jgi:hypothetical protein
VKVAARAYFVDHPSATAITSESVLQSYLSRPPQARYRISPATVSITAVCAVADGWREIVFSISQQKWVRGAPDMDHPDDQDIP